MKPVSERKPKGKKKESGEEPVSLHPMTLDEALKKALETKPEKKGKDRKKKG